LRLARYPEHATVSFHFSRRAESLGEIIGKLHRRTAVRVVQLAHEVDRIESIVASRIAVAKIVCEQCAPAGAATDARLKFPFLVVEKIAGLPKVFRRSAVAHFARKMRVQPQNVVHIEAVGSDEEFLPWIAPALLEPPDVFVARDVRIFAVSALSGPRSN